MRDLGRIFWLLPACCGFSFLPVIIAVFAYDSSPPLLPEIAHLASVRHFDLGSAGSWISLICVLLPAALVAPDSRQLDILKVLGVFERWEKVGII